MAELKITIDDGRVFSIKHFPLTIGSAADNHIVITADGVAEHHATIAQTAEGLSVCGARETYLNQQLLQDATLLTQSAVLTLGSVSLRVEFIADKTQTPARRRGFSGLFHPVLAVFYFVGAIALPLWQDYLNTPTRYVFNWRLTFYLGLILLILVWVLHSMIAPLAKRYLLFPLLGLVSLLALLSDGIDIMAYWGNFQFSHTGFDILGFLLSSVVTLSLVCYFLRRFVALSGASLLRYTLALSLPCLLLLTYSFMQPRNFFAERAGSYPEYHQGLLPHIHGSVEIKTVEKFLKSEN